MSDTTTTGSHWIDAARYVLEHKAFVMVEPDGSWHPPTERDLAAIDSHSEVAEVFDQDPVDTTGVLLDSFTASMLVQIYDKLGDENRQRFHDMDLLRAVDVGWKLVARAS